MRARAGWREVLTILFLAFSSPAAGAPFDDPEAAYRDARAAWVAGDVDAAAAIFAALAEQHPDNADYLLGHGQGLLATQRSAQAVPVLERALELAPAYLDVMQVLLRAYETLGEDTAAASLRARAARLAPDAEWTRAPSTTPPPVSAAAPAAATRGRGRVTMSLRQEHTLTERDDTWRERGVGVEYAWSRRALLGGHALRSRRFGVSDTLFEFYGAMPLSEHVTLSGRGYYSPTRRVRVHHAAIGGLSLALSHGFVIGAEGGRLKYDSGPSDMLAGTVERYFSAYRLAYTLSAVQPAGGPWSPGHRFSAGWYYGQDSRMNLSGGFGRETDESVLGAPLLRFDTWNVGVNGRHWLTPHVAFDYAVGYTGLESPRGNHLDRTSIYVGIAVRN